MSEHPSPRSAGEFDTPERPNVGDWATPPRIGEDLPGQIRDCLADLPWYFITPFVRHWHRTWEATPAEAAATMPGDDLLPRAQYVCTRAINIDVPPVELEPHATDRRYAVYQNERIPRPSDACHTGNIVRHASGCVSIRQRDRANGWIPCQKRVQFLRLKVLECCCQNSRIYP